MSLSMKLEVRQSQSLVMTPQLLQSIRLLQCGHHDLRDFVEREADRNPLIVVEAPARDRPAAVLPGGRPSQGAAPRGSGGAKEGFGPGAENLEAARRGLADHAFGEIADILRCPRERSVAEALLVHLDEAGYLRVDPQVSAAQLGVGANEIERVLLRLRETAEPAGLFAGDLTECLALQLARRGRLDPVMRAVLHNLELLARRDFSALRRLTGEDEEGLFEILAEIRALDPKPGLAFDGEPQPAVEPDAFVTRSGDGGWHVELNNAVLPRVLIDSAYAQTIAPACRAGEEKDFLGTCQTSAQWLVRSLDQRAQTILKVAGEIVRRQAGFLEEGIPGLKPMTLASVADALGMHESTVSRVTANKYIETPRGTLELKFFFTVAISSSTGGEAHSAASVKHRIRLLVEAERPGAVLSDDEIAARLKEDGVDLARRTVAKYREALGIPSSVQRRREMNARKIAS